MYIIDFGWEIIKWLWYNRDKTITWASIMYLLGILLEKFGRKLITNQLKRLFHVRNKSEFSAYVENQKRIESKVDMLLDERGLSWDAEKIKLSLNTVNAQGTYSSAFGWVTRVFATPVKQLITATRTKSRKCETKLYSGRLTKMKSYLSKLSSTKLQALIIATIMNVALLVGYVMDVQDIQSKVDAWMPMANMIVQTILTIAYQWSRASVDKAELKAQTPEVKSYDYKGLDSTEKDSIDA